jgi:hypothetical protein
VSRTASLTLTRRASPTKPARRTESRPRATPPGVPRYARASTTSAAPRAEAATQRSVATPPLRVGRPRGRHETEAHRTAEHVARPTTPNVLAPRTWPGAAAPAVAPRLPAQVARPGGPEPIAEPIAPHLRARIEGATQGDLGAVRVVHGPAVQHAAAQLGARAFTYGGHIFLGAGERRDDAGVIAHEATHALQQRAGVAAHSPRGPPAPELTPAEPSLVQRLELPDWARDAIDTGIGVVSSAADSVSTVAGAGYTLVTEGFWPALERLAPSVAPYLREISNVGILEFLRRRIATVLDGVFGRLRRSGGLTARITEQFLALAGRVREIGAALANGCCEPLFAAVRSLRDALSEVAGRAWDAIADFFRPVGDFFSNLWQRFGAPVVDFMTELGGDVWSFIQNLGSRIWDGTAPVRELFGDAWTRIKEVIGIGGSESEGAEAGGGGILGWITQKAGEAWSAIQEQLEPVIAPVRAVGQRVAAILPLEAIGNLRDSIVAWTDSAMQMADRMDQPGGVSEHQDLLRDVVLPGIQRGITNLRGRIGAAASWVNDGIGSLATGLDEFLAGVAQNPLLSGARSALSWLRDEVTALSELATQRVAALFEFVDQGLDTLAHWVEPILNTLRQVFDTLSDLMGRLGDLVIGRFWRMIPVCIRDPIKDFIVNQILRRIPIFASILEVPGMVERAMGVARRILVQVFADGDLAGAAWTFFSAVLELFGLPPQLVTGVLRKAARAIGDILRDPLGFFFNLLRAIKEGFLNFLGNFGTHLLNGVAGWLFGTLGEAGIRVPTEFSLRAVFDVVLQVLDITQDRIFAAIERRVGPERAAQIRRGLGIAQGAFRLVQLLITGGPAALWEEIQSQLSGLWDRVLDGVIGFLTERLIASATRWLMSLLDVTGIMPVINSLIATYRAIESFFRYLRQLLEIVSAVLDGIGEIARGITTRGAAFLENGLASALPIAIGFLANQLGLGALGDHIRRIITAIRATVDRALDWVVDRVVGAIQAVVGAVRGAVSAVRGALGLEKRFATADGESHRLYFEANGSHQEMKVASEPRWVRARAREIVDSSPVGDPRRVKAERILALETESRRLSDVITAEGAAGRGNGSLATSTTAQLNTCMQTISDLFIDVFPLSSAANLPRPEYEFEQAGGLAKRAEVRFLSANRPIGSEPAASPLGWGEFQSQGLTAGGAWVQMHLINARLGGHGNAINLVPGSRANNRTHLNRIERTIKRDVGDVPNEAAAVSAGLVCFYKMDVAYHTTSSISGRPFAAVGGRLAPRPDYCATRMTFTYGKYTKDAAQPPARWPLRIEQHDSFDIDIPPFQREP